MNTASPCLNPIENLFGNSEERLAEMWVEKPSKSVEETISRFRDVCKEQEEEGEIFNLCKSMPRRLRKVIAAKGGPIKY